MLSVTLAAASGTLFLDLLPWLLALLVIVIIGGVFMYAAKRLAQSHAGSIPEGFTLQGLRDLHAAGDLSDEEFERAKAVMIGQVKKAAENRAAGGRDSRSQGAADKTTHLDDSDDDDDGPISS